MTIATISQNTGATYPGVSCSNLSEEFAGENNKYPTITAGTSYTAGQRFHGTLKFPGLSNIPAGATISSASITLTSVGSAGAAHSVGIHKINVVHNQAASNWGNRDTGTPWATPGGFNATDVDLSPLATATTGATSIFSGPGLVAWVQGVVAGSIANNGVMLVRNPDTAYDASYQNYCSQTDTTNGPVLTIDYTVATGPTVTSASSKRFNSQRHSFGLSR